MEAKQAIAVIIKLREKHKLDSEEKEALAAAIGALDCAVLAESKLKGYIESKKSKRQKMAEL